jgi:hypothetical protein
MSNAKRGLSRRSFLKEVAAVGGGAAAGAFLAGCVPATPEVQVIKETVEVEKIVVATPEPEAGEAVILRVLSLPWPQTPVEQQMANEIFTPAEGIEVSLEGPPYEFAESKMRELGASQSPEFDIWEYDSQWLGAMALAGAMEDLSTADYFGSPERITSALPTPKSTSKTLSLVIVTTWAGSP